VSERQSRDILGVLKTRASGLDLAYLRKWANELKVSDILEHALKEMKKKRRSLENLLVFCCAG